MKGLLIGLSSYCYRSTRYFYLVLALVVSAIIALLWLFMPNLGAAKGATFDTIMKMRWTSPQASQEIVILDVDEKSLAEMAITYGRWPWKRDVFARVLAELEYVEAKSIMFTVLITDSDKEHPRSDAALSYVASESFVTAYPVVRLPPQNDKNSKMKVCDLIPAGVMKCNTNATLAAIIPALPGMRHDLGIMNNKVDDDGILRSWSLLWEEPGWKMPTNVGSVLAMTQIDAKVDPDEPYILNWRNKKNHHQRVSLVDYMATLAGEERVAPDFFKGKHVIIAASAPGLTIQYSTSVGLVDDGEILATALDDAINGTDLKRLPEWVNILLAFIFIWAMAIIFSFSRSQRKLDGIFVAFQSSAFVVMALAINYTGYFVDILPLSTFGLIYYTVARLHLERAEAVFTGKKYWLSHYVMDERLDSVGIISFYDENNDFLPGRRELLSIQKGFDDARAFAFYNSFEDDQLLGSMNHACSTVVVGNADSLHLMQQRVQAVLKERGMKEHVAQTFEFPDVIKQDRHLAPHYLATKVLAVMTQLPDEEEIE
ncbi:MAG: CHASE2 domain-containing protein [Mariprofundus sp.]|nr:CHASE2 domain-containing protein [Mariprofundus sp.]